jgi:hypothetical protein
MQLWLGTFMRAKRVGLVPMFVEETSLRTSVEVISRF